MRKRLLFLLLATAILVSAARAEATPDYVWAYQGDVAFFEENGKAGLPGQSGEILHAAEWDDVYLFSGGLARVKSDGK